MTETNAPLQIDDLTLGNVPPDIWLAWGLLTCAMLGYWYVRYRQSGVLTLDVFFIGLYLYVPIVFMSIFAFSPLNAAVATGEWHWLYVPKIREAFYVSLLGTAVFLLAAALTSRRDSAPAGYRWIYQSIDGFWCTRHGLLVLGGALGILGLLVVATMGVTTARVEAAEHTEFRPLAHLFSCFAVIGIYVALVEGYRRHSWRLTALGALITLVMLSFGTRKVTVGTLLYYAAIRLITSRSRKVGRAAALSGALVLVLVLLATGIEGLREQDLSVARVVDTPVRVLFGNNLSELRDFSWILAGWDGELLLGRTYVSGALSWIPSFLLPDRKEWGWGQFSTRTTALDGGAHPGLRPTVFAEAYFNFDLVGVVVFATLLGALFGRVAAFANRVLSEPDRGERAFLLLCAFLYFEFFLRFQQTAGYFQSYVELSLLCAGLVGPAVLRCYGWLPRGSSPVEMRLGTCITP